MRILLLFLLCVLALILNEDTLIAQRQTSEKKNYADLLTDELNQQHAAGKIHGFSVAIVNDKKVLYNKGFGLADFAKKTKYTTLSIQNVGSISKTLVGIALLKAQEQGKLLLDDPINKYLPFKVVNPHYPDNEITIRQLATHTSSIADAKAYADYCYVLNKLNIMSVDSVKKLDFTYNFNNPDNDMSMEDFYREYLTQDGKLYNNTFLNEVPGAKYRYSNTGSALAALILEYATGTPFDEYTRKYITKPLKMKNSGWSDKDVDMKKHTVLYAPDGTAYPLYHLVTYPDGGFITSSSDLSKYLIELIKGYSGKGSLLEEASYKELFRKQLTVDNYNSRGSRDYSSGYDICIFIGFTPNGYVGHTGSDPGTIAFMFFNPVTKYGHIVIANQETESLDDFLAIWDIVRKYEKMFSE